MPVMSDWKPALDAIVGSRHGGKTDHVLAALRDLDNRHPNVPEIAVEQAFTFASQGSHSEALAAYERALALGLASPAEQANTLAGRAVCLLRLDRPAEAVSSLEYARVQFPDHAEFAALLAIARHRAGRKDEAFALLLDTLLETSDDIGLAAHQRTLRALVHR
jgi:tetratricopeptide (TPR) repeat protein